MNNGADVASARPADVIAEGSDSELTCKRDDVMDDQAFAGEWSPTRFATPDAGRVPFRCIRVSDASTVSTMEAQINVVNISRTTAPTRLQRELAIPLHEIKTKAFLKGRALVVVSDGTQYGALEKECPTIKASGVGEVIALLPETVNDGVHESAKSMTPREFVAERAFGAWHIVNLTGDALPPLLAAADSKNSTDMLVTTGGRGLERTLIVADENAADEANNQRESHASRGQVFILDGGVAGLRKFQTDATAMARALERPRIGERGCAG